MIGSAAEGLRSPLSVFGPEGPLDEQMWIERRGDSTVMTLESAGGGRNTDYDAAFQAVLDRAGRDGWSLDAIYLASREVRHLEASERRIEPDGPVDLADPRSTRRAIQRSVALAHRRPGAGGGGNPQKRIELHFSSADPEADLALSVAPNAVMDAERALPPPSYLVDTQITVEGGKARAPGGAELEKAWRLHNQTQMLLVDRIHDHPRSETVAVPRANVDVAWTTKGVAGITIAEVKSFSPKNEVAQIRMAIGEVLHFAEIARATYDEVATVIFVPWEPGNPVLPRVCSRAGIELCWPRRWPRGLD